MPTEGIKLIRALYRDPTIENLKKMMNVFVYRHQQPDRRAATRPAWTTCCRASDHLENFVKSQHGQPQAVPR